MVAAANNNNDELLPELEMSITPSKLTDNVKVDMFGLSEVFLNHLAKRGHIADNDHKDTQYMPMTQLVGFCKTVRDMYRVFNAKAAARANV